MGSNYSSVAPGLFVNIEHIVREFMKIEKCLREFVKIENIVREFMKIENIASEFVKIENIAREFVNQTWGASLHGSMIKPFTLIFLFLLLYFYM